MWKILVFRKKLLKKKILLKNDSNQLFSRSVVCYPFFFLVIYLNHELSTKFKIFDGCDKIHDPLGSCKSTSKVKLCKPKWLWCDCLISSTSVDCFCMELFTSCFISVSIGMTDTHPKKINQENFIDWCQIARWAKTTMRDRERKREKGRENSGHLKISCKMQCCSLHQMAENW